MALPDPPANYETTQDRTLGTTAHVLVGALLLGNVIQGHLPSPRLPPVRLGTGLLSFPAVLVGLQGSWSDTPDPPRAASPVSHALNLAVFVILYLLEPTGDAALIFYGASMSLAALRGYAGCEVLGVSNWLLHRDDQVGCTSSGPSTSWTTTAVASGQPRRPMVASRVRGASR
jgi:hypothetical protein